MFWSKNKKNRYTPAYPSFTIYTNVGYKGVFIERACFLICYKVPDLKGGWGVLTECEQMYGQLMFLKYVVCS